MRAAWLEAVGGPLVVTEVPDPVARPGGAVVEVLAVRVPSYTAGVFSGQLGYDLPAPLIPGPTCIGRVESVGEDVFDLSPGDVVLCNSLLSSGGAGTPDEILIGWTGTRTGRSARMQALWRHGSFAEKALYPVRCLTVLPGAETVERARLPFLASFAIADAGLQRGGMAGGMTVVVNGATGQLGGAGVLMALARGAARVVAVGRNHVRLAELAARDGRIRPYPLIGDRADDAAGITVRAGTPPDLVVDLLGPTLTADATLAAIDALRLGGTAVLVGGVKRALPLAYGDLMRRQLTLRGSFMFTGGEAASTWHLARASGSFGAVGVRAFALDEIDRAIERAAGLGGLDCAVLLPNGE